MCLAVQEAGGPAGRKYAKHRLLRNGTFLEFKVEKSPANCANERGEPSITTRSE